jgi:hypothetical protein
MGINSVPILVNKPREMQSNTAAIPIINFFLFMQMCSNGIYRFLINAIMPPSFSDCGFKNSKQSPGVIKIDIINEDRRAIATVFASGANILPSIPSKERIGTNVMAIIRTPKILGFCTVKTALRIVRILLPL